MKKGEEDGKEGEREEGRERSSRSAPPWQKIPNSSEERCREEVEMQSAEERYGDAEKVRDR